MFYDEGWVCEEDLCGALIEESEALGLGKMKIGYLLSDLILEVFLDLGEWAVFDFGDDSGCSIKVKVYRTDIGNCISTGEYPIASGPKGREEEGREEQDRCRSPEMWLGNCGDAALQAVFCVATGGPEIR